MGSWDRIDVDGSALTAKLRESWKSEVNAKVELDTYNFYDEALEASSQLLHHLGQLQGSEALTDVDRLRFLAFYTPSASAQAALDVRAVHAPTFGDQAARGLSQIASSGVGSAAYTLTRAGGADEQTARNALAVGTVVSALFPVGIAAARYTLGPTAPAQGRLRHGGRSEATPPKPTDPARSTPQPSLAANDRATAFSTNLDLRDQTIWLKQGRPGNGVDGWPNVLGFPELNGTYPKCAVIDEGNRVPLQTEVPATGATQVAAPPAVTERSLREGLLSSIEQQMAAIRRELDEHGYGSKEGAIGELYKLDQLRAILTRPQRSAYGLNRSKFVLSGGSHPTLEALSAIADATEERSNIRHSIRDSIRDGSPSNRALKNSVRKLLDERESLTPQDRSNVIDVLKEILGDVRARLKTDLAYRMREHLENRARSLSAEIERLQTSTAPNLIDELPVAIIELDGRVDLAAGGLPPEDMARALSRHFRSRYDAYSEASNQYLQHVRYVQTPPSDIPLDIAQGMRAALSNALNEGGQLDSRYEGRLKDLAQVREAANERLAELDHWINAKSAPSPASAGEGGG